MTKLAIIALNRFEHRQLLDVWKFFPFQKDVAYFYVYTGADAAAELPEHANFQSRSFAGGPKNAIQSIQQYLNKHKVTQICFASLASFQIWTRALGIKAITIYGNKKLSLADVSALPSGSENEIDALAKWFNNALAILAKESASLPHPPETSIYEDFQGWLKTGFGELLLTVNTDLISAVCAANLRNYSVLHYSPGWLAGNLAIREDRPDFLQTLDRLAQAVELARHNTENGASAPPGFQNPAQSTYSLFAEYYDAYMSHVNYEDWITLMLTWYKQFSDQPIRKVLELACGTANAAEIMVFKGYEVDACDNSPHMLHMADAKAFKPNLFLNDLTDPLPQKDYDFIFCLFDSINYLTQKAGIKTLLKNVHKALRPGGVFIFDISTLLNSLDNFNDTTSFTRVKDGYLVQISTFEILSNRQITHLILFRKNLQGFDRLEERHAQRVYRTPELAELIAASGLKLKAVFAPEMRANLLPKLNTDIDHRYFRLFFLLQKDA